MAKTPEMNADFARWYAEAFMDEGQIRTARWKGVVDTAAAADYITVEVLVRYAFATAAPADGGKNEALAEKHKAVLATISGSGSPTDPAASRRELQILSAAVLARLFSTLPDAAVAVLNASFGGMRTVDLPMDLPDLAKRALVEFSRRKHARPGEKEFEIVAPKVDFEVSPEAVANMSGGFFIVASRRRVSHLRGSRVGFEDDARTLHGKPPFAPVASTLTCKVTSSRGSITARPSASRRAKHSARSSPSSRETPLQDRRRRSLKSLRQKKIRREILLARSELSEAEAIASREGFSLTRWIVALISARPDATPQLGQREIEVLARSNLQMLAIGRNLNQIARAANAGSFKGRSGSADAIEELHSAVMQHARQVVKAISANVARWRQ
ncbi:MAG: hypothetical protein JWR40_725 [Massilia sp.]|nr:hypothetical protein [Massilia sp.]